MTGCSFPTGTREDVVALDEIEAPSAIAELCKHAVLGARYERWLVHTDMTTSRPRLLTGPGGKRVPNRARHIPVALRVGLLSFRESCCPNVLTMAALGLMHCHMYLAWRKGRRVKAGLRPRRVTPDEIVIVRGRR